MRIIQNKYMEYSRFKKKVQERKVLNSSYTPKLNMVMFRNYLTLS